MESEIYKEVVRAKIAELHSRLLRGLGTVLIGKIDINPVGAIKPDTSVVNSSPSDVEIASRCCIRQGEVE